MKVWSQLQIRLFRWLLRSRVPYLNILSGHMKCRRNEGIARLLDKVQLKASWDCPGLCSTCTNVDMVRFKVGCTNGPVDLVVEVEPSRWPIGRQRCKGSRLGALPQRTSTGICRTTALVTEIAVGEQQIGPICIWLSQNPGVRCSQHILGDVEVDLRPNTLSTSCGKGEFQVPRLKVKESTSIFQKSRPQH